MGEMIIELKPKFCFMSRLLAIYVIKGIVASYFLAGLLSLLFMIIFHSHFIEFSVVIMIFINCYIIIFLMVVLICAFVDKKNFEVTSYKVYNDKIEFDEGFFNHKHTSLLCKDIKEIHLKQNFIQRRYGIGTIRFITPANNSAYGPAHTGIKFQDIENSKDVYETIKKIYDDVNGRI